MKKITEKESYKEKEEEIKITDDEIKRNYYKFLVMVIIIPIVVLLFLSPLSLFIFSFLGLLIIPIGSIIIFRIFRYNLKKMTNRNKGIIEIVNGIIILSIGLWHIQLFLMIMIETSGGSSFGFEYFNLILGIFLF